MANKDLEFRVGVIILLGIIILAVSVFWLRDYQLEHNATKVIVIFDDIGTLAIGDRVNVSGLRMGKVNDLKLTNEGVEVQLLLSKEVNLRRNSRFIIKNVGLMGERFIAVDLGSGEFALDDELIYHGEYDTGLPEVMGLMGDMIVELRVLVGSITETIGSDSTLNKFSKTIFSLEEVSSSLSGYLKRNETKMDQSIENILAATQKVNSLVADNKSKIDSTVTRMDASSRQLVSFTGQLDTLAGSFRQFAENLNNPEGTLQLLTEDRRLYDDLRKTADNLDDLITDIKSNPKKYINLKVEIF